MLLSVDLTGILGESLSETKAGLESLLLFWICVLFCLCAFFGIDAEVDDLLNPGVLLGVTTDIMVDLQAFFEKGGMDAFWLLVVGAMLSMVLGLFGYCRDNKTCGE